MRLPYASIALITLVSLAVAPSSYTQAEDIHNSEAEVRDPFAPPILDDTAASNVPLTLAPEQLNQQLNELASEPVLELINDVKPKPVKDKPPLDLETIMPVEKPNEGTSDSPSRVEARALDTISVASFGQQTGIPSSLWQATNTSVVYSSLELITQGAKSPAFVNFLSKLLTTAAMPPSDVLHELSFLGQRALTLFTIGKPVDAAFIVQNVPEVTRDHAGLQTQVSLLFLERNLKESCAIVDGFSLAPDAFWVEAQLLCALTNNDRPRAELTLNILLDDTTTHPNTVILGERLLNKDKGGALATLKPLRIIDVMLIAHGSLSPVFAFSPQENPALMAIVANMRHLPFDDRVKAAEIAVNYGTLPVERLRDFYNQYGFSPLDLQQAFSELDRYEGGQQNALLWQALFNTTIAHEQLELIDKAMRLLAERGLLTTAALLYHPTLQRMAIDANQLKHLKTIVTLAVLANDRTLADTWLAAAARSDNQDALAAVWPIMMLANNTPAMGWESTILTKWLDTVDSAQQKALSTILLSYLSARGYPIPDGLPRVTQSAEEKNLVNEITLALTRGDKGTAILLSSLLWQKNKKLSLHADEIKAIVASFDAIGDGNTVAALILDLYFGYAYP